MPFFAGEIFVSEVYNKPVLDQTGEEIGKLKDIIVGMGEPFPAVTSAVVSPARKPTSSPGTWSTFLTGVSSRSMLRMDLARRRPSPRTS